MYMIGGALILDKYGNRVHLMYLNLLRDLNNIKKYSWGSACLANLYRELCRASLEAVPYYCNHGLGTACLLLHQ